MIALWKSNPEAAAEQLMWGTERVLTRRDFIKGFAGMVAAGGALAGYAFGLEPIWRLSIQRYRVQPRGWPAGMTLKIAAVADLHACEPYMPVARIEEIVATTNRLNADLIVLLGDFTAGHRFTTAPVPSAAWAKALSGLEAPLGVHAILGNHDWWDDRQAQRARKGPPIARRALENVGVPVYENSVVRLQHKGQPFWLAGLGDQIAFLLGRSMFQGVDDLDGTLAKVTDNAPVILLAHEPDIFTRVPARVSLTLSGHTHGGQVRLFGYSPVVPSRFGNRFAYGHVVENNRHLIVSGGLGCSIMPVRFGVPPEILEIQVG